MDDREPTKEQLIQELKAVRQEFEQVRLENQADEVQGELLRTVLACGEHPSQTLLLRALSQQVLRSANRLTLVDESSLFLLDERGTVIESVLARGAIIRQERESLVGRVLHQGLAGWVYQRQQIGIITDTTLDERWLQLPGEPYHVRSVLCVPVLRKNTVLAIITLMHPDQGHFRVQMAELMEAVAVRIGLVLEVVRCLSPERETPSVSSPPGLRLSSGSATSSPPPLQSSQGADPPSHLPLPPPPPSNRPSSSRRSRESPPPRSHGGSVTGDRRQSQLSRLNTLGLYIVVWDGKFIYANPKLAKIFGYKRQELANLKGIFSLVTNEHYDRVSEQVYKCIRGQTDCVSCIFQGQRKGGKRVLVEIYGVRTRFYGKPVLLGVLRDIS
ncbi:hypothetical protein AY600_06720 [Phormidium willei BDU 130791]|nr:hypothetical protein AY600_06720 [Phormidium willei BDU 130791]